MHVHRAGVWLVHLLVVLRRRQDVVGVEAGGIDAPVDRDDHLELRPQVLEKLRAPPRWRRSRLPPTSMRKRGSACARRLGDARPPALLAGLVEVLVERALHLRIVVAGAVPDLAVAAVVVPEERRRVIMPIICIIWRLEGVGGHLVGHASDRRP